MSIEEFFDFIAPGISSTTTAIKIYKFLDSSPVVKALSEVGQSNLRAAVEFINEEKFDLAIGNLGAAHQCCYKSRVKNTSRFTSNLNKLCEADYYICCLIAFIYYKKNDNQKNIEKYLYHAFCARENAAIYDEKGSHIFDTVKSTLFSFLPEKTVQDVVTSSSRKEFFIFCENLIDKVNCLETKEAGLVYQVEDDFLEQLRIYNNDANSALLGTSSIRVNYRGITFKIDQCSKVEYMYGGSRLLLYYYRIYVPLLINDEWSAIIKPTESLKEYFFGSNQKFTKQGKIKYTTSKGSNKTIELINSSLLKNNLADIRAYIKEIEVKEDGLYFWTNSNNLNAVKPDEILPNIVLCTFCELAMTLSNRAKLLN